MMEITKTGKKICALGLFFGGAFLCFALDWPVREGALVSNFGSNDGGIPVLGNSFTAAGSVYPSDVGHVVFVHDPGNTASRFPSPLGSWTAVDHGDNLVGIYSRYESRGNAAVPNLVEKNTVIASAGSSGWTGQNGVYFALFDRKERRWINPSLIISTLEDPHPPVIRQVELRNAAGTSFNPAQVQRISQGLYTIYVDTADTGSNQGEILAPNRIICSVNGVEAGVLSFETLVSKNGRRMVYRSGIIPASGVYSEQGFALGEIRFTRGQASLVVEVLDMAGNSRSSSFRLTVE
ncbi:MAG: hypothetical protein LBK77_09480 [Spirochaetaceae bacterium]|jgi:hypothetical protein|nr:hypothetical protein [Spirochaetaceae bacterium]